MGKIDRRRDKIISLFKTDSVLSIKALSETLKVSTMTVRRDLEYLAGQGIVQFYHGGAVVDPRFLEKDTGPNDYYLQQQAILHREEKIRIAKKAVELLLPQETIMLDSGTSIFYLAREIPANQNLTIICWSLNVMQELIQKTGNSILVQGGIFHPETQMCESNLNVDIIKSSRASKAFISAGGFHSSLGITSAFHYEVETKRAAIKSSMTSVLLIDSSKFGKVCSAHITEVRDFRIIITDSGIPPEYKEFILNEGLELIIV
ncbi:MAG: DeoR/GlpR family DNA-binding transcription regulator [Treponema sp.]|jgi:DeoR family deoxyribose operon repressor|nr:DeoR/GlpR family DNA-binding transcription regulator [Treponema sp.]